MRVDDYMVVLDMGSADVIPRHKIDVTLIAEGYNDLADTVDVLKRASASNGGIVFGSAMPVPEKIFRCGNTTTVIWKDGTKTIVKLMSDAEDSDYGAFTAALAKKIYGGNGKVMKYAGMVQRVKSKAEKKATRKLKRKYEEKITGEKKYIVSQYGQVAECKGVETEEVGIGEKVIVFANDEGEARCNACHEFDKVHGMNGYLVYSDGECFRTEIAERDKLGKWCHSSITGNLIRVFARNSGQALKVLKINPAPKEGDKP